MGNQALKTHDIQWGADREGNGAMIKHHGSTRADIAGYPGWYNTDRPRSCLSGATPDAAYLDLLHAVFG